MSTAKYLITGSTGKTGGYAIDTLLQHGASVRALVHRHDDRSLALQSRGVEIVQGELNDFDTVHAALKGIDAAYFVFPIQMPGLIEASAYFAQAAAEQNVHAIVNMSQISARREATSNAARNHWLAERLMDKWGVSVTNLRPTFFAEWTTYFAATVRDQDQLILPFGEARFAPIAAEDQGRAIANILLNPASHAGKTYSLYGPTEVSQRDIAGMLSKVTHRNITYVPIEIPQFTQLLRTMGYADYFQQHIANVAQDCRDGVFSGTNDNIEMLTGQKPLDMPAFLERHKSVFIANQA